MTSGDIQRGDDDDVGDEQGVPPVLCSCGLRVLLRLRCILCSLAADSTIFSSRGNRVGGGLAAGAMSVAEAAVSAAAGGDGDLSEDKDSDDDDNEPTRSNICLLYTSPSPRDRG